MQVVEVKNHIPVYNWMGMTTPDEWQTVIYAQKAARLPWAYHHVALMADGHIGIGPAVGSVIAMKDAVSPAAVGVDIGCGVLAVKYNLKAENLPDDLLEIRKQLESAIPLGYEGHQQILPSIKDNPLWNRFSSLDTEVHKFKQRAASQCGSLGKGNHFCELCLDSDNYLWLILHSGSRNIGKQLAEKHISIAKNLVHNRSLEDKEFAVLLSNTPEFIQYINDLQWAQDYALLNRRAILYIVDSVLRKYFYPKQVSQIGDIIQCHHNYVSFENHFDEDVYITRKGAISAKLGELGIIPSHMGGTSYVVEGLGNLDSYTSASHGAGRSKSRKLAKKSISIEELEEQTRGVECRKDRGVLDEAPSAYKSIVEVMANQADLVKVVKELRCILCVKGGD